MSPIRPLSHLSWCFVGHSSAGYYGLTRDDEAIAMLADFNGRLLRTSSVQSCSGFGFDLASEMRSEMGGVVPSFHGDILSLHEGASGLSSTVIHFKGISAVAVTFYLNQL